MTKALELRILRVKDNGADACLVGVASAERGVVCPCDFWSAGA